MFGRLLNTLSYHATKIEREWRSQSKLRREYSYGIFKEIIFFLARQPLKWSALILMFFGMASLLVSQFQFIEITLEQLNRDSLVTYFSTVWGIQTTITALIYPIVISFISLLLQKRNDARSYLNIYLHDTASIFSGLNSLFLVILMGVQVLFLPIVSEIIILNWIYICAIYLIMNLILVSYFLYQTFQYIRPNSRKESLKRYLINETWPSDFKLLLKPILFQNASEEKELLKFEELHTHSVGGTKLDIETGDVFEWGNKKYQKYFTLTFSNEVRLVDIRFFFLKLACRQWAKKAIHHELKSHNLAIKLIPGRTYSGVIHACMVDGYNKITFLQKVFFRLSFKFRRITYDRPLDVDSVLQDLKAEVLRSLQSRDLQGVNESLNDLREFIVLLIKSSQTSDINYSTLRSRGFWGGPQYEEWIKVLHELIERSSQIIGENYRFISALMTMPREILYEIQDSVDDSLKWEIFLIYKKISYEISNWCLRRAEDQGVSHHSICNPFELNPPYKTIYIQVLSDFLGGWEQVKKHHILPREIEHSNWGLYKSYHKILSNHLATTIKLLRNAVTIGDKMQSIYLMDSLLKWYDGLRIRESSYTARLLKDSGFINSEIMKLEWYEVNGLYDFSTLSFNHEDYKKVIFSLLTRHLWVDYTLIFLFWLARQYQSCIDGDRSLILDVYKRIVIGDHPLKSGSILPESKIVTDISEVFEAILRIHYSGFFKQLSYSNEIDGYIRNVFEQFHMNMISGRSYSGNGGESLYSMRDGILLTLLVFTKRKWDPSRKYQEEILTWIEQDIEKITKLKRDIDTWRDRANDVDFLKYEEFYKDIKQKDSPSFDVALEYLVQGLDYLSEKIDVLWKEQLLCTEYDKNKLLNIELWSSYKAFSNLKKKFPTSFFETVDFINEKLTKQKYTFPDCSRGWFTKPKLEVSEPSKQFYEELLLEAVPHFIWRAYLKSINIKDIEVDKPDLYWETIKNYESKTKSLGKTPVLLLNSRYYPEWISGWIGQENWGDYTVPKDLVFRREEAINLSSYLGHINETEVHLVNGFLDYHRTMLVTRESFKRVAIKKTQDDRIVELDVEEKQDTGKVNLNFCWEHEIEIEQHDVIFFNHLD